MKEISELHIPDDVRYLDSHEWARAEGETVVVGISDYAQNQLGDVVFVELPETGSRFAKGEEFGSLESVKAVSEIYLPVGGEIMAVNENLRDNPALVNESPYQDGWLVKVRAADPDQVKTLLDRAAYLANLQGK